MAAKLIDTSIAIDLQRDHPPALAWLGRQTDRLFLPRPAWFELIRSSNNKQELVGTVKLCRLFASVEPDAQDQIWAAGQFLRFHLSHRISEHDCLIAAIGLRLGYTVYTQNISEFELLIGNLARKPY